MSNPFCKEPEHWRVNMKENKPTFEQYLKSPAYPRKGGVCSKCLSNDEHGLTKLEAFTMNIAQGMYAGNVGEDEFKDRTPDAMVASEKLLKALYDHTYGWEK